MMKKLLIITGILTTVVGGLLSGRPVKPAQAAPHKCDLDHKIYICHENSGVNGYSKICVDKNSTVGGHDDHNGDIIPSFQYWGITGTSQQCPNNYVPSTHSCPGACRKVSGGGPNCRNYETVNEYGWVTFAAQGDQSILANNCVIPDPVCDDEDGDGICDEDDNCENVANPDQADANDNGIGDACEQEPTDLCRNLVGDQETLPTGMQESDRYCSCKEGFHRVDVENVEARAMSRAIEQDNFTCEADEPEESPEPSPESTPTPKSESKARKEFWSNTYCDGRLTFESLFKNDDGSGQEGKLVRFFYNNEVKETKTNVDGKAAADFGFAGVKEAKAEFDGESMTTTVKAAENCPAVGGQVLGATTGKVLGASTLASTGIVSDTLMNLVGFSGMALTAMGYRKYGKKN